MFTHSASLYLITVCIWGSTFFAIKFQLGAVAEELSIAYRFALAALLLFGWCLLRGVSLRFRPRQHGWMALQGIFLFGINYLMVYWATSRISSGLIALLLSTIVLMNIINSALFFRKPVNPIMVIGGLLGLSGIASIFSPELIRLQTSLDSLLGVAFSLLGSYLASLGNIISARNQGHGIPVMQSNAYGMAYGAVILLIGALLQGYPLRFDPSLSYNLSLLYLAVFGSILAFGGYLTLIGRIGPEKAGYVTVLFPLVALAISTLFEDYHWSPNAVVGVVLVLLGNLLVLLPGRAGLQFWKLRRLDSSSE